MKKRKIKLILNDQLNSKHSWFNKVDENIIYLIMEIRQETDYVMQHIQKIMASFAAMRNFAKLIKNNGHKVHYIKICQPDNSQLLINNIDKVIKYYKPYKFCWQKPDNYQVDKEIINYTKELKIKKDIVDSEHFYTHRKEVKIFFKNKKKWIMEMFYRYMRKKHNILMNNQGKPEGGKWNYDIENRKKWKGQPKIPKNKRKIYDCSDILLEIKKSGIKTFGNSLNGQLIWPIKRSDAVIYLKNFINKYLPNFGTFQDAMDNNIWYMFHSLLSFAMNVKILSPKEIINKTIKAYYKGKTNLANTEGFVRQILGWREYVRGIYWAKMPKYIKKNYFKNNEKMPKFFWDGNTKMNCLSNTIKQSLNFSYAHHIQRLMIIGNFALLSSISIKSIQDWYLGIYIDAFEWVEAPNTIGLSQYADGGLLASKPYVSSSCYINKMSNYCQNCFYENKKKYGLKACPYNSLYWYFFHINRNKLINNKRLKLVYYQLDKISNEEIKKIFSYAKYIKKNLYKI